MPSPIFPPATTAAFPPRQVTHTWLQTLDAPPDRVLPLLTAEGERAWAVGWEPEVLRKPAAGHVGTVFITRHGGAEALWWCTRFDEAAREVAYLHVTPGSDAVELAIRLDPAGDGQTRARVSYAWTSLGPAGEAVLAQWSTEAWGEFMRTWEDELNRFLRQP